MMITNPLDPSASASRGGLTLVQRPHGRFLMHLSSSAAKPYAKPHLSGAVLDKLHAQHETHSANVADYVMTLR